jgi:hypothetical protein
MAPTNETEAFAERLRRSLDDGGVRQSPTIVANEFNLRYWGRSITPHTARNWLLGKSIPTQDKLRVLADWLQVSPDELRFGRSVGEIKGASSRSDFEALNMTDREMISRYLALNVAARNTVRDVVTALTLAATVQAKG